MRSFVALFRKELRSYFGSPLVYLVAAAFLAYTGSYFHSDLIHFVTFGFGISIMENFWKVLFIDIRLVMILSIPLLTMRLFAEERRLGTLELLLTYPLRDGAIVAAKLGACLVVICTLVAGTFGLTTSPSCTWAVIVTGVMSASAKGSVLYSAGFATCELATRPIV